MRRLKKSKRVSWATGAKLCQVKLFLSEDCPTKVGLQAKTWMSCSNGGYSEKYHSRFEGRHSLDSLGEKLSHIPQTKWKCPPKFVLSYNWHVAASEESEEKETQKHREMRVLEAVYPHLSDIPPCPLLPLDVQECHHDDNQIPPIPITPIEEEGAVDLPSNMAPPRNASFDLKSPALPQTLLSGNTNTPQCGPPASLKPSANEKLALELLPDFQAAAAAITAIMKSKEQGSLIDTDLLIKLLSDPKMIEKLIIEQGALVCSNTAPLSGSKPLALSVPLPSTKPGSVEEVINEDDAPMQIGSKLVSPLVAISCPKPDPVIKRLTNEPGAAANTGGPNISGSKPVTARFALPVTKPDPVVKELINEHRAPTNAGSASISIGKPARPQVSLPSAKADLVKFQRSINEYGTLDDSGNEPIPRSMLSTQQVPTSSPELDLALPARVKSKSHPLPNANALSADAPRLNLNLSLNLNQPDLQSKFVSLGAARLSLHPLPKALQPSLPMKAALSPDSVPTSSFSAMNAYPVKDMNYIKSLIKQHGEIQETQDYNLSQAGKFHNHFQDLKLAPNHKPNELKLSKVHKPCIFFNTSKGCRNGSNCLYRHNNHIKLQPRSLLEAPSAKRMKLVGEITGRT